MLREDRDAGERIPLAQEIKKSLHGALGDLGGIRECVLLNFPTHTNPGDHLIFLGEISYLVDVLGVKIHYIASRADFSDEVMKKLPQMPILLAGGGCVGDIWVRERQFHERIIARYRKQPVIIMPQCVFFKNARLMRRTAGIFNTHPDLTLYIRDETCFDIAKEVFYNCRVLKSPDMSFQLAGIIAMVPRARQRSGVLYLSRNDKESYDSFSPECMECPGIVKDDWVTYRLRRVIHNKLRLVSLFLRKEQNETKCHRFCRISNQLVFDAACQLGTYRAIVTDRLHGHILATLLGIPNILLPNTYHKNEAFYKSWTHVIPICKFARTPEETRRALKELLKDNDVSSKDFV